MTDSDKQEFIRLFNQLAEELHDTARGSGFWDEYDETVEVLESVAPTLVESYKRIFQASRVALAHSELSEKLEYLRHGDPPDDKLTSHSGAAVETADLIIREMETSRAFGLDVARALLDKADLNKSRQRKHGKTF